MGGIIKYNVYLCTVIKKQIAIMIKKISFVTVKIETEINDTDLEDDVLNIFPMEVVVNSLDENVKVISTEITDFKEKEI